MTLRVWWVEENDLFETKGRVLITTPVIRLDDLRAVVEGYLADDVVNAWSDNPDFIAGYEQAINDLLAQLKGVGDEH